MSGDRADVGDSGRRQNQPERGEALSFSNPEIQNLYSDTSVSRSSSTNTSSSDEVNGRQENNGSNGILELNTNGLFNDNSSVYRLNGSVATADYQFGKQPGGPDVTTADFQVGKTATGVKTAEDQFGRQVTGTDTQLANQRFQSGDEQIGAGGGLGLFERRFGDWQINQNQQSMAESSEPLLRQRDQSTHIVRKGEDLERIARTQLGPKATDAQRETFQEAVRSINGLEPGQTLQPGQKLQMPGINENGEIVHSKDGVNRTWLTNGTNETVSKDGTKVTNYPDKSTRIDQPDGTVIQSRDGVTNVTKPDGTEITRDQNGETTRTTDGVTIKRGLDGKLNNVEGPAITGSYDKRSNGDGGTVERAKGSRPEQNFTMIQSKEGGTEVFDKAPDGRDRVSTWMNDESIKGDRQGLIDRAEKHITDPQQLAKFKADMVRFEARAQETGMPAKEVSDTYKAISRMMDGGPNAKLSQSDRNDLAKQVISQAATPTSIDQGNHNTCNVTVLESQIYSKEPSRAANLVADVALTGQFKAANGSVVKIPENALKPNSEARQNPPLDGDRSFASQLFQVGAVNLFYQNRAGIPWQYDQIDVPASERHHDTGERLRPWGNEYIPFSTYRSPSLTSEEVAKTSELLTGRKDPDRVLQSDKYPVGQHESITKITSPEELGRKLEEMKREGRLPAAVVVHTGNPPFGSDPTKGGWHVVNITDYDASKGEVKFDNQWGSQADRLRQGQEVKVEDMYKAMMNPTDAAKWQEQRNHSRDEQVRKASMEQGRADHPNDSKRVQEINGLDLAAQRGVKVGPEELRDFMQRSAREWKGEQRLGDFDAAEHKRVLEGVNKVFDRMTPADKIKFLASMSGGAGSIPGSRVAMPENAFNDMFARTLQGQGWSQNTMSDIERKTSASGDVTKVESKENLGLFQMLRNMPADQRKAILGKLPARDLQRQAS